MAKKEKEEKVEEIPKEEEEIDGMPAHIRYRLEEIEKAKKK